MLTFYAEKTFKKILILFAFVRKRTYTANKGVFSLRFGLFLGEHLKRFSLNCLLFYLAFLL